MMRKTILLALVVVLAAVVLCLGPESAAASGAPVPVQQETRPTPAQLIEAVNNLRLARGLNPLTVHPILMQTAQQQADALLASGGAVGHNRPNGISFTDQLLLLGYPLAGDLSQGGYRAENWLSAFPGMPVEVAIEMWLGDVPHTNTMVSPFYQHIGAGVAYDSEGYGFMVIDCAMPTASGKQQAYTPEAAALNLTPGAWDVSQFIKPVVQVTARPDGDVVHVVENGQSLWSIAIAYGTKIDEIRRLNNISDMTIYVGQKLLVLKGATQPAPEPPESSAVTKSPRPSLTPSPLPFTPTPVLTPVASEKGASSGSGLSTGVMIAGFVGAAVLFGGIITWLTTPKEQED